MVDEGYQPFPDVSAWAAVPFDPTTYDQYAALLEQARAEAPEDAREHAVRTAIRYAGTDTGAIEGLYTTDRGFTRTVAIEAASWEAAANERGPNAAQVIKDQIEAYGWVLDFAAESRQITENDIRELHTILCRSQDTYTVYTAVGPQERVLHKGQYKEFPNNPTSHATGLVHQYAPPDAVPEEMHRLVASMSTTAYREAHPIVQAAYLHYALVVVHPFADGNGRTTRALASAPLYRALRVPLLILSDARDEYLDSLAAADAGDLAAFLSFVRDRVIDVVDLVIHTMRAGQAGDEAGSLERLRQVVTSLGGRTHSELDAIANRLLDAAQEEFRQRISELQLPEGITTAINLVPARETGPSGYRMPVANARILQVIVNSAAPASANATARVRTLIATADDRAALRLEAEHAEAAFAVRDLEPMVRDVAKIKIAGVVDATMNRLLKELADAAEAALRQSGYRG